VNKIELNSCSVRKLWVQLLFLACNLAFAALSKQDLNV
jgi:hypothetical protein